MKFKIFTIVAILFSIALANGRRNKRREPTAGLTSKVSDRQSTDGANITKHVDFKDICDGKPCPFDKNVCHKHPMKGFTYECIPKELASKRYPKKYTKSGAVVVKTKTERRRRRY